MNSSVALVSNPRWVTRNAKLKYLIGEKYLFSVTFSATALDAHFSGLTPQLLEECPKLSAECQAAVIPSCPILEHISRLSVRGDTIRYVPEQYRRYFVHLDSSFTEYLAKFNSDSRYKLQRKVRKFAELSGGKVHWEEFRTCEEISHFLRRARDLSKKTYQERLLHVGLPETQSFVEASLDHARSDSARGYILYLGGEAVAFLFCVADGEVLVQQYLGYDPDYRKHSPGTVLHYKVLERLFEERRFRLFDFATGQAEYKEFFSTGSVLCANVYYVRRTASNAALIALHNSLYHSSRIIVHLLDRLKVKTYVKQWMRRAAG